MWTLPLFLAESELATEELKVPLQHNTVVSGAQKTEQINLTNESEADQRIIILLYHLLTNKAPPSLLPLLHCRHKYWITLIHHFRFQKFEISKFRNPISYIKVLSLLQRIYRNVCANKQNSSSAHWPCEYRSIISWSSLRLLSVIWSTLHEIPPDLRALSASAKWYL